MGVMLDTIGKLIAGYLQKEVPGYEPFTPSDPEHLRGVIQPGDVLLVEGNNRISGIIKYLTQSTWSHAALYVGPIDGADRARRRAARPDRGQYRRGRDLGAAVEIFSVSHPAVPPGRPVLRGPHHGVPLRHQPDRLRLRHQEHRRPDALSDPAADAAALAAAHDRVRFRRSHQDHLLGADRAGVRRRALSDPAQDHPRRLAARPGAKSCTSAIPRSTCRAISTSRPISKSSNPPSCTASTTPPCTGPTSRSRSRR